MWSAFGIPCPDFPVALCGMAEAHVHLAREELQSSTISSGEALVAGSVARVCGSWPLFHQPNNISSFKNEGSKGARPFAEKSVVC